MGQKEQPKNNTQTEVNEGGLSHHNNEEQLEYITSMLQQLKILSDRQGYSVLSYMISVAELEAQSTLEAKLFLKGAAPLPKMEGKDHPT